MAYKKGQCKECGKKLSEYNKGRYCYDCNPRCVERDEELIAAATRSILVSENQVRILTDPARLAKEIAKHRRAVKEMNDVIGRIKRYEPSGFEEGGDE